MKIKRFFAPDMRRAIQQVRQAHGPDAVILSSNSVDGGVEIVSALDYDPELLSGMLGRQMTAASSPEVAGASPAEPMKAVARTAAQGIDSEVGADRTSEPAVAAAGVREKRKPAPVLEIEWTKDPALQAMQLELTAMKGMLNEQFARLSWADLRAFRPARAILLRRVSALGLDESLANSLVGEIAHPDDRSQAWREVMLGLARRLKVAKTDPLDQGGVLALVGPTGVGKTTTIAKLAARHCLRHGSDSLALISTDNFRVGAQRQLDAYGAILGVPVRRADNAEDLSRQLAELRDRRLVLIDTAGMAPRDCRLADSLGRLSDVEGLKRVLVLPANMQLQVMRDAVRFFGGEALAGVALTKLDECPGLGAAVSALIESGLPALWLSEGQRVPEDLKLARVIHLLGWAGDVDTPADSGRAPPGVFGRQPATFREAANASA
ncbi:MAG: flagellar biosynthesis protein FlhF [Gammaproteobacteria bacterium]|nr:flagellar biosynthesis protein FlhF [Gammaproteobacteria bacterium]